MLADTSPSGVPPSTPTPMRPDRRRLNYQAGTKPATVQNLVTPDVTD
jgi:hypothetical protein